MSITLSAYPMAFLVSPEEAKKQKIQLVDNLTENSSKNTENKLRFIDVNTNMEYASFAAYMRFMEHTKLSDKSYLFPNGLRMDYSNKREFVVIRLSGCSTPKQLQSYGEDFFQKLDAIAQRNVRVIKGKELFYYNYETEFVSSKDIYKSLKQNDKTQILSISDTEVLAIVNGQNVKYYKNENDNVFYLRVEQSITILNIGKDGNQLDEMSYGLQSLKINTNIKSIQELKLLLQAAGYSYYRDNGQTPLKISNAVLNWVKEKDTYVAHFEGSNNAAIIKEAEQIFKRMNKVAQRDLRLIDDVSTMTYTYKTNYSDKSVLLNTLTEHGAKDISENGDEITCNIFDMQMKYFKPEGVDAYQLDIVRVSNVELCENTINDINDEYALNIQEMTYNKIKERLDKENLRLESETVLEDNSIILTIEV